MSLKKIIRKNIEDNAVTEPKLAAEAVTAEKLSTDFVTGLTELSEQAANDDTLLIYDSSAGALKKVSKSNTTVLETPVVSSVSPTSVVSDAGTTTFTITGTGFTAGTNARLIGSNGRVRNFATVTRDSTTQLTATINVTTDMAEVDTPYGVQVIDGTGLNDLLASQIDIDQYPVFVTASGSLGTVVNGGRTGLRFVVNANDPDSAAAITYELQSGTIPPGLSLSNETSDGGIGVISGDANAVGSDTTFNFTIRAVDAASNTSSRAFSITIQAPVSESFTSSGTFSVPSGVTTTDVLLVAGGGGGGNGSSLNGAGGGGGGGLIFFPAYPITPGGTITVTVGCGGANNPGGTGGTGGSSPYGGQNSVFGSPGDPGLGQGGVLTAIGGGGGGGGPTNSGGPGGSGGGGSAGGPGACGGTGVQPTQPGNSGAYGFGNPGVAGNSNPGAGGGAGGGAGSTGVEGGFGGGIGGGGKAYTIADGTTPVYYAGGAGGGQGAPGQQTGGNGQDGGGQGAVGPGDDGTRPSTSGQANKGGGGGGGSFGDFPGSPGGKGIVIVRY